MDAKLYASFFLASLDEINSYTVAGAQILTVAVKIKETTGKKELKMPQR